MIKCKTHGTSSSYEVSRDLSEIVRSKTHYNDAYRIKYEYINDMICAYVVTKEFAELHSLSHNMLKKFPKEGEDVAPWEEEIVPVCKKCFDEYVTIKE